MAYITDTDPAFGGGNAAPANPAYDANKFKQDLTGLYQKYYNRDPSADELKAHMGNPGGIPAIEKMLAATPNQSAVPNPNQTGGAGANGMPQGIDPRLAALYQKSGMTPGGRGTGFSDWQYWQDKMNSGDADYFLNRLSADLAGTGTDQPTGTLGHGAWDNSGASDRNNPGPTQPPGGVINTLLPPPQTGYGPSMNTPNAYWTGRTPLDFYQQSSQIPGSGGGSNYNSDPTGILAALLKRIKLNSAGIQFDGQ